MNDSGLVLGVEVQGWVLCYHSRAIMCMDGSMGGLSVGVVTGDGNLSTFPI